MRTLTGGKIPVVMLACFSAGFVGAQQPTRPDPLVREGVTEKISEHVYVIPDGSVPLVPNIGIIVGCKGTFVVDTGLGARNGQAVLREADRVSSNGGLYRVYRDPEYVGTD